MKIYQVARETYYDDFSAGGTIVDFTEFYADRDKAREKAKELAEEIKVEYKWQQEDIDEGYLAYSWAPDAYYVVQQGPFKYWGFSVYVKEIDIIE